MNPDNPGATSVFLAIDEMAKANDVRLHRVAVRRLEELNSAFEQAKAQIDANKR